MKKVYILLQTLKFVLADEVDKKVKNNYESKIFDQKFILQTSEEWNHLYNNISHKKW